MTDAKEQIPSGIGSTIAQIAPDVDCLRAYAMDGSLQQIGRDIQHPAPVINFISISQVDDLIVRRSALHCRFHRHSFNDALVAMRVSLTLASAAEYFGLLESE
jgi:hypothetical protein